MIIIINCYCYYPHFIGKKQYKIIGSYFISVIPASGQRDVCTFYHNQGGTSRNATIFCRIQDVIKAVS